MPRQLPPKELARRLEQGERPYLLDVRARWEHELVSLPDSVLLPLPELPQRHDELQLEPGQALVVYCHHGSRSYNAAAFLESVGFQDVLNLEGGIDAWARTVDPTCKTY